MGVMNFGLVTICKIRYVTFVIYDIIPCELTMQNYVVNYHRKNVIICNYECAQYVYLCFLH